MKDHTYSMMRIANISFLAYAKRHEIMVENKGISNTVCYDMLAQSKYREVFQYVPNAYRGKNKNSSEYTA
jgi:hypothetical protein